MNTYPPIGPITFVEKLTIQATDGFVTLGQAAWVYCVSGSGTNGVQVKGPALAAPLSTSSSATTAITTARGNTVGSLDPAQTNIVDVTSGFSYATTQTETTYTEDVVSLTGNGRNGKLAITGVFAANQFIPSSLTVPEWGSGYAPGDVIKITCNGAANDPFDMLFKLTSGGLLGAYNYPTAQTNTGNTAYSAVNIVTTGGRGSGAQATVGGTYYAETTGARSPGLFRLTRIDVSAGGTGYQMNTSMSLTCGSTDPFDILWRLPSTAYLDSAGAVTLKVAAGDFIPFPVTELKNLNTTDWDFTIVG